MVFNSGDFQNGISFSFRLPQGFPKGDAVAAIAAVRAKIEKKRNHVIHQFYGFQRWGFKKWDQFFF